MNGKSDGDKQQWSPAGFELEMLQLYSMVCTVTTATRCSSQSLDLNINENLRIDLKRPMHSKPLDKYLYTCEPFVKVTNLLNEEKLREKQCNQLSLHHFKDLKPRLIYPKPR